MRSIPCACAAALALVAVVGAPAGAEAFDAQVALGVGGGGSAWDGDGSPHGSLKLAYLPVPFLSVDFLGKLAYGPVDERLLEWLSLGSEVRLPGGAFRPRARLGLVHQHEEPRPAIEADPVGALMGVGDGIRHRGGLTAGVGADLTAWRLSFGTLSVTLDVSGSWFPDDRGPAWYLDSAVGLAFDYSS